MAAAAAGSRKRPRCKAGTASPSLPVSETGPGTPGLEFHQAEQAEQPDSNPAGVSLRPLDLIEGRSRQRESDRRENELLNRIADLELSLHQLTKKPRVSRRPDDSSAACASQPSLNLGIGLTCSRSIVLAEAHRFEFVPSSSFRSVRNALIELLCDSSTSDQVLAQFLHTFPFSGAQRREVARSGWETVLEDLSDSNVASILSKMNVLHNHGICCPAAVFRLYVKMEWIELLCTLFLSQVTVARVLSTMYACMTPRSRQSFASSHARRTLRDRLIRNDKLLVAAFVSHASASGTPVTSNSGQTDGMIGVVAPAKRRAWRVAHYARHGPLTALQAELRTEYVDLIPGPQLQSDALQLDLDACIDGCPMLFQPLLECLPGWTRRLCALLEAGFDAGTIYRPWHCSALHMLCYRKPGKGMTALTDDRHERISEQHLVSAAESLLRHGATRVLNVADRCEEHSVTRRTSQRTALIQAASDGRLQLCRILLKAGADWDLVDSHNNTCLDYLFYLKHSNITAHRRASAGYACVDIFGLVMEFGLLALLTDELRQCCKQCRACRWLFMQGSVAAFESESMADSESDSEVDTGD